MVKVTKRTTATQQRKVISKKQAKASHPPDTIFLVDGTIPSGSLYDAVFLADYLADTRNRPVEIRRTISQPDCPDVYVRQPRDVESREQIHCLYRHIVLDGDRVVFKGDLLDSIAFMTGRGAGVLCSVSSRKVSASQQLEDEATIATHLKSKLRSQGDQVKQLRLRALRHGLKAEVEAFDRMYSNLRRE